MRDITLYTDTPVGEHILQKFKLAVIDQNGDSDDSNHAYTFINPTGIAALERTLDRDAPDIDYTIVINKREVKTYKYLLIEMPPVMVEDHYNQYVDAIINFAETVFGGVSVGETTSLPNQTPEQVLSIVISGEEEEEEETNE